PPRESPPHGAPTVIRRQMGNAPIDTTDDQNQKEEACAYKGIAFTLYIGTCDGFSHFDSLTGAFTPYNKPPGTPNSLTNNTINALYKGFGEEGHIWLGTEKGLHRFNRKTGKITNFSNHPNAPKSLANNWIYSFYRDRSGVFWIGTGADGIYKVNPYGSQFVSYLKHVDTPHSQVDSSIDDIYLGSKGKLWLGTAGGLKIFDRATQQFTHYKHEPDNPHSLSYTEVRCIYEDASGVFWIGTRGGGLNRFDRDKETFTHNYAPPVADDHFNFDKVDCIFEDRSRRLWVGYYGGGLNCLAPDRKQYAHYRHQPQNPNSLTDDCIGSICQDRSGIFWLGGQQGLNRLDLRTGKITHFKHRHDEPGSLSHDYILCIFEDSRGALWIGTQGGGFNRLDKQENRFAHFTEKNGLPNNVVYGIMEDDDGLLWLSTNKGLAQFNRETGRFTNYAGADGLQSDEFNFGAYCKSKDGEFFFGGINGFNAFFPRDILKNSYEPPIVFTKFSIFNKEVHIGRLTDGRKVLPKSITELETLVLTYDDTIFSLQFAALNYVSPEKNQYAYMMEGFEKEWNYVGNRNFVSYNSLKAGQYTFRVKGSNNDGLWNREGASVRIIIIPPFWQSKLFKFFMFALALGLVYFFYRLHIRSMEKRSRMLEEVVNRRTEEVQKEREVAEDANLSKSRFLARMSHEIRTPMNAVIGFTEMLQDTRLSEEQAEFVRSIRQGGQTLLILIDDILDFSKIEAGKLTFEPIDFDLEVTAFDVCELMAPRIDGRPIELRCLIDENVPALVIGDAGRFRQVFINLIGNAIKFTERGEVRLSLDVDKEKDNRLLIHTRIKDTGIGISEDKVNAIFEEFKQADDSTTRKFGGTGLGLAICRQIARLMDGNVWAESRVGHGSVFHFTAWVQKSSKTQLPRKILPHLRGRRVLIADDNADNMEIVTYYLEKMGMQVTALDTAEKVPLFLQENADSGNPMDLCILDIHSPGIKGREILENIRNNPSYSALPVLAFTTSTINRTGDFREWGFDGVLPRPVHRRKLVQMITRLLSEADSEAEPIDEIADLPPVTPETPVQRGWDKSAARQETVIHSPRPWLTQHSLAEEAKHSVCILLVEDNPINCKLAGFMLTKAGYHVHTVHNGKEAVDTFSASPENFDLIFMDVQMPVMDGKEATKQIRAKGRTQVPNIAVTADIIKG
ncbi:MAG: response regulator, partial [bacterium]|nr:response regulator [bacterium]